MNIYNTVKPFVQPGSTLSILRWFSINKFNKHFNKLNSLVVYKLGVLAHFVPWDILGLGVLAQFRHKKTDKKN